MQKKKLVIVGAGFGGVYTVKNLQKNKRLLANLDITVVNPKNHFLFTPLLPEVATGGLDPSNATIPLRDILPKDVTLILSKAEDIDSINKKIVLTGGKELVYDFLILAVGSNTVGFADLQHNSNVFMLKTLEDATRIKNSVIDTLESPESNKNFVIVGGGATGIEVAAELVEFSKSFPSSGDARFYLITMDTALLNKFHKKFQIKAWDHLKKLGVNVILSTAVEEVRSDGVVLSDKNKIISQNIIWAPGVTCDLVLTRNSGFPVSKSKRVETNEYLQLSAFPEVFCIGDVVDGYPTLAQVAVRQACVVAKNIEAVVFGNTLVPFEYKSSGNLVSLGRWNALAEIRGKVFWGRFAWWLWRTVYLFKMPSRKKQLKIVLDWTLNLFYSRDITKQ